MVAACAASGGVGSIISPLLQLLRSHIGTNLPYRDDAASQLLGVTLPSETCLWTGEILTHSGSYAGIRPFTAFARAS